MVVLDFLHRWVFVDLWVPVWPNIAAAVILCVHITKSNKKHRFYIGKREGRDDNQDQGN
jgi:hypothetical protein